MAVTAPARRAAGAGGADLRWVVSHSPLLIATAVVGGVAIVLATTAIGSGDYGQWLMAARPYLGLGIPEYRAGAAVPPVMPALLALVLGLVGDPLAAVRLFAVLVLGLLGASAYLVAATLFHSRWAGLLAAVLGLVVVDRYLELFAFGGLLQAGAIVFASLAVASFWRAASAPGRSRLWWTVGALGVGLTALTHTGSAYILVPAGCAAALIAARRAEADREARLRLLAPLGAVLAAAALFWLFFLLPGGTDLTRNPASLDYRGPNRLLESLTDWWPTALVAGGGAAAIGFGAYRERARRRLGPWTVLAAWMAITLAVVLAAVVARAATDYPRFATLIVAPLVTGAAGALAVAVRVAGGRISRHAGRGSGLGWSLATLVVGVLVATPLAVDRFATEARGYRLADVASFTQAASWIEANLGPQATILAPVREAKWIEGLTGRGALFSNPFRYSFRAEEWQRSLAADTLLRSNGAVVNQYFFTRLVASGSDPAAARDVVIAANHGGEYVDLLSLASAGTRILSPDPGQPVLATLTNLAPTGREVTATFEELRVSTGWTGERHGVPVGYRQTVVLRQDASVLDLRMAVETSLPIAGLELELTPAAGMPSSEVVVEAQTATFSFARFGSGEPQLRIVLAGGEGTLRPTAAGGLLVRSSHSQVRLLVTDLTAASSPTIRLQWLDPADLVERYGVRAVLLATTDPAFDSRRQRIESLGFAVVHSAGPYVILIRDVGGEVEP